MKHYPEYENLPYNKWPDFEIIWNRSLTESLTANGNAHDRPEKYNKNDYLMAEVNLKELFVNSSTLTKEWEKDMIWENLNNGWKIANIIGVLIKKIPVAPPMLNVVGNTIVINDGHHRLAVCFIKQPESILIILPKEKLSEFQRILRSLKLIV